MTDLRSGICKEVGEIIASYDNKEMVAIASGLLTLPRLSANSIRCETLVHLSIAYARGSKKPNRTTFKMALNDLMGRSQVAMMEDPQEDVFVSNVLTEHGDLRVFNALWEGNDYFVQVLIDIVTNHQVPEALVSTRESCISLLKLSEEIANRAGIARNSSAESIHKNSINVPRSSDLSSLSKRVLFSVEEMEALGVTLESISPFIISDDEIFQIKNSIVGNSILEEKPIVELGGEYIVSLPSAIGLAIRKCFLRGCEEDGSLDVFSKLLADYQARQLLDEILREFKGDSESVNPELDEIPYLPVMHSLILKDDSGNYIHTILLHDDIRGVIDDGMASYHTPSEQQMTALSEFIFSVAEYCKSQPGFRSGLAMTSHGGLGRGYNVGFDKWPDDWGFSALSLNDLLLLSGSKSKPLKELFQCIGQKRWVEDNGVKIQNINGDMNYYGFWKSNDYQCSPDDIPIAENSLIALHADFIFTVRKELRVESDKHSAKYVDGSWRRVERLTKDSFYEGIKSKPIYVSVEHVVDGYLNGLVESGVVDLWFGVVAYTDNTGRSAVYEWWSGFIHAVEESLNYISSNVFFAKEFSLQVNLDFSNLLPMASIDLESADQRGADVFSNDDVYTVVFQPNFMANFSQPENHGEREVLSVVIQGLSEFLSANGQDISDHVEGAINYVIGDEGVRFVHIFKTYDPVDYLLLSTSGKPKFVDKKQATFDQICINKKLDLSDQVVSGKRECGKLLNGVVDEVWTRIKCILETVERRSILTELVVLGNAIEQDRGQWSRTAKAVKAIYSKYDDVLKVAHERNSERSLTSLCLRSLVEMAICECPEGSGVPVNECLIDDLLSLTSLLINTASDSDAIHWGLVKPEIIFNMNGTYSIPTDVMTEVLIPYFSGHFQIQFGEAVESYEEMYESNEIEKAGVKEGVFGDDFDKALNAEFGFSAHEIVECWAEIIDMHIESSQPIISMDLNSLIDAIASKRGLDRLIVSNFIEAFSLFSRDSWDSLPEGYGFRDIAPWKYKRRLSCLVKPIIRLSEDEVLLSLSLLRQGVSYFLDRARNGEFNTAFFNSDIMCSYVGSMVDKRGAEFTKLVAGKLDGDGWYVRKEVLMKTIGAPQELGDIDVLAIKDGVLLIFECKKLQMAKTVSEIADVCNRFRGEEKDELRKHLNRVNWVSSNLSSVIQAIGYKDDVLSMRNALLTSTQMPMKYKNDLPISSDDIVSFRNLDGWLN